MNPDLTSAVHEQLNSPMANELSSRFNQRRNNQPLTYLATPGSREWTLGYTSGSTIPRAAINAGVLRPLRPLADSLGFNHLKTTAIGAAGGALVGGTLNTLAGGDPVRGAIAGGAFTGLGSLLASMYARSRMSQTPMHQEPLPDVPHKRAFYALSSPADDNIEDRVMEDASLSYVDKSTVLRYVNQLSPQRKSELSRMIGPVAGAGVGMAVARYLLQMGIGGTALLGIIGAAIGSGLSRGPLNAFGQHADASLDMFGQHRYI
jgi:hypothetical protein